MLRLYSKRPRVQRKLMFYRFYHFLKMKNAATTIKKNPTA
jgi:hypothetical protein